MTGAGAVFDNAGDDLRSAPINPAWVRAGAPQARARELSRSLDGTATTSGWDCTAGAFDWYFGIDETVYVIEGEVFVRPRDGGEERRLGPGDTALFRAGTWSHWRVPVYVRKVAFCRQAIPRPVGFALRLWTKLKAGLGATSPNAGGIAVAASEAAALPETQHGVLALTVAAQMI